MSESSFEPDAVLMDNAIGMNDVSASAWPKVSIDWANIPSVCERELDYLVLQLWVFVFQFLWKILQL